MLQPDRLRAQRSAARQQQPRPRRVEPEGGEVQILQPVDAVQREQAFQDRQGQGARVGAGAAVILPAPQDEMAERHLRQDARRVRQPNGRLLQAPHDERLHEPAPHLVCPAPPRSEAAIPGPVVAGGFRKRAERHQHVLAKLLRQGGRLQPARIGRVVAVRRAGVQHAIERALPPDQCRASGAAMLLAPVGVDEPEVEIVRRVGDGAEQGGFVAHGSSVGKGTPLL